MNARPKSTPSPAPDAPEPAPVSKSGEAGTRPRNMLLFALMIGGLWPAFWFAGVLLLPLSFWATWPGRWQPRHWIMVVAAVAWGLATAVSLSGNPDRAELGLGDWNPPEWMVAMSAGAPLLVWAAQAVAIGGFVWVLWSRHPALAGRPSED